MPSFPGSLMDESEADLHERQPMSDSVFSTSSWIDAGEGSTASLKSVEAPRKRQRVEEAKREDLPPAASNRSRRKSDVAVVDDYETETDDEGRRTPTSTGTQKARRRRTTARTPARRTPVIRRRKLSPSDESIHESLVRARGSPRGRPNVDWLVWPIEVLAALLSRLFGIAFSPLLSILSYAVWTSILVGIAIYLLRQPISTFTALLTSPLSFVPSPYAVLSLPTIAYCSTIGIGCSGAADRKQAEVARLARSVATHAHQAHDIFASVVRLGDPKSLGLYHPEIWELGIAVKATTRLETREELGRKLQDLGDMTRDVKDQVIKINSLAINAFSCASRALP